MDTWNENNLPENHEIIKAVKFVAVTEDTWSRTKQDGSKEIVPKWDFITAQEGNNESLKIGVYSATDKEQLEILKVYDLVVKKAVGKDGQFYGYSLKGFAPNGQPIPRKEPQSRFQKNFKLNTKVEALKCAVEITKSPILDPDSVIEVAEIFDAWLNDKYKAPEEEKKDK